MLDVSYFYYGDTIRCVSKLKGFEVQWDRDSLLITLLIHIILILKH